MGVIEDIYDLEVPLAVELSPNSQQVLFSSALKVQEKSPEKPHAYSKVWLAETGKEHSARQLTSGLYNDKNPRWNPDGKSIAFISDRGKAGESSALYELSLSGGEPVPLTEALNEKPISTFEYSPNGKFIAFLSADEKSAEKKAKEKEKDDPIVWGEDWAYDRLRLVHIASKTVTTIKSGNFHLLELAWNDDSTKIATFQQRNPDIESPSLHGITVSIVNISSKASQELCTFPNLAQSLVWVGDALHFVGPYDSKTITSAHAVFSINVSSEASEYIFNHAAHGIENCADLVKKAGKDVVVQVKAGMEDQLHILKGRKLFGKKQSILAADLNFTHDSDEMVIAVATGDINTPPEVYTTTSSGGAMVQLSNLGHAFKDVNFGTVNFISCETLDKKEVIEGMYITPSGKEGSDGFPKKPLSTAVHIHGGPYYRITNAWNPMHWWIPPILASGHGVLVPNYRGSSGRGEKFAQYGPRGLGQYDEPDIVAMTQYVIEKGWADKDRLIVGGGSQGGFLSYLSAVRNGLHGFGWKFRGAIPYAGVTDWDAMSMTSDVWLWQGSYAGYCPWMGDKDDTFSRRGSPIWEFKAAVEKGNVLPAMLMLHGEKDVRVPVTQAWGFMRGLDLHGLPFEFVTYPREGHTMVEKRHIQDMVRRVQSFADTHLS